MNFSPVRGGTAMPYYKNNPARLSCFIGGSGGNSTGTSATSCLCVVLGPGILPPQGVNKGRVSALCTERRGNSDFQL